MEKAVSHYNSKKQLLQESQEELAEIKQTLEDKERDMKTLDMEKKMLQLDLDKAQTNEKKLVRMVASLEAQVGGLFWSMRTESIDHEQAWTEMLPFQLLQKRKLWILWLKWCFFFVAFCPDLSYYIYLPLAGLCWPQPAATE